MISIGFPICPMVYHPTRLAALAVACIVSDACAAPATPQKLSFINDVAPVLTKASCNTGACHAKAGNGQNGLRLSLFGFEPEEDFEHIVKEDRGNIWAGGGIQTGGVIGATDKRGKDVVERKCGPDDFLATIYHHLGIASAKEAIQNFNGRPTLIVQNGRPIPELIGRT